MLPNEEEPVVPPHPRRGKECQMLLDVAWSRFLFRLLYLVQAGLELVESHLPPKYWALGLKA